MVENILVSITLYFENHLKHIFNNRSIRRNFFPTFRTTSIPRFRKYDLY